MKIPSHAPFLLSLVVLCMFGCLRADANEHLKKQILKLFPQADANQDGVISDAEEAAVSRQALKRYPQADRDGDGSLSLAEKQALLRMAAKRARAKAPRSAPVSSKTRPSFSNVQYGPHERQVFDL